jgi:hypothetical protein
MKELEKLEYDGWGVVKQDVLPGMGNRRNRPNAIESISARSGIDSDFKALSSP